MLLQPYEQCLFSVSKHTEKGAIGINEYLTVHFSKHLKTEVSGRTNGTQTLNFNQGVGINLVEYGVITKKTGWHLCNFPPRRLMEYCLWHSLSLACLLTLQWCLHSSCRSYRASARSMMQVNPPMTAVTLCKYGTVNQRKLQQHLLLGFIGRRATSSGELPSIQ